MKTLNIIYIILIGLCLEGYSQRLTLTSKGLVDSANINKNYVVIEQPGKSKEELYDLSIDFVNIVSRSSDRVIEKPIKPRYLVIKGSTFLLGSKLAVGLTDGLFNMTYSILLRFKDEKVRVNVHLLKMYSKTGRALRNIPVFLKDSFHGSNNSGRLFSEKGSYKQSKKLKISIEKYFNNILTELKSTLNGTHKELSEDW